MSTHARIEVGGAKGKRVELHRIEQWDGIRHLVTRDASGRRWNFVLVKPKPDAAFTGVCAETPFMRFTGWAQGEAEGPRQEGMFG